MNRTISIFLSIIFSLGVNAEDKVTFSFDCVFDRHYAAYVNEDKTEKYKKGRTYLSIIEGQTASSSKVLDSSKRATNSDLWLRVANNELGGSYIGDNGDLLSIMHKPNSKSGNYKSVLQWAALGYAYSSVGKCEGGP